MAPDAGVLVFRIAIGTVLGAVIGYERDRQRLHVGLRTHMVVALSAATFMVLSVYFRAYQDMPLGEGIDVDASRIAASVVSGIGFLAGGAILRTGLTVQGLTTAAGLWLVTAIGMTAGAGMYTVAVAVTMMGITILALMRRLEARIGDSARHRIEATIVGTPDSLFSALAVLEARVEHMQYERLVNEDLVKLNFDLLVPHAVPMKAVVNAIEGIDGLRRLVVFP